MGKMTERVKQFGHDRLSVFGIGTALNQKQWRAVMRQLVAQGHLRADSEAFGALKLTESARGVLKGETAIMLREETAPASGNRTARSRRGADAAAGSGSGGNAGSSQLLGMLRAWRSETARKRGVPAYVVLHDATLEGIAATRPQTHAQLRSISGVGDKKLERYGDELIALVNAPGR
jgi:ATP-dependent DNA helicase RecQ